MSPRREIRVGLSISLTGGFAWQGQQALAGLRLWQSYTNAQGGVALGVSQRRPVRVLYYDDQSRGKHAQQNVFRLLRQDRVDLLLGPYGSNLTLSVAPLAEDHKKLLWNHGGTSDEIFHRGYRYLVGIASPASDYLRGLPRWLAKKRPELRRICVLQSQRGTFASQVGRGVVEAAAVAGFPAVEVAPLDSRPQEPEAAVCTLSALGPEVLILAGSFPQEVQMLKRRHSWPGTVKAVAAVSAGVRALQEELAEKAEGIIGPSQWEPDVAFPKIQGPNTSWFVHNFRERFGQSPEYIAASSFAAGLVLAECVRRAGSLQDEALRAAAAELDFHTFYGGFRIDPATGRQIGHRVLLTQWQQGRKAILEKDELGSASRELSGGASNE